MEAEGVPRQLRSAEKGDLVEVRKGVLVPFAPRVLGVCTLTLSGRPIKLAPGSELIALSASSTENNSAKQYEGFLPVKGSVAISRRSIWNPASWEAIVLNSVDDP